MQPISDAHFVSVVIPVLNEAKHIENCLRSLTKQDYPSDKMEIFVVDGMSTDGTPDIIRRMCVKECDRRIATPAALIKEFEKIGYRLKDTPTPGTKFGHRADSAPTIVSMRALLEKSENTVTSDGDPLAFETQDVEIQDFVDRLKRRKRMRKLASTAAIAAATVLALLVFAWLVGVM